MGDRVRASAILGEDEVNEGDGIGNAVRRNAVDEGRSDEDAVGRRRSMKLRE